MMDEKIEANGSKTLRDRFPIYCASCGEKIGKGEAYRITGISLARYVPRGNPGELAENVYRHRACINGNIG